MGGGLYLGNYNLNLYGVKQPVEGRLEPIQAESV